MSRRQLELNRQAQDRWPTLYAFFAGSLHEDWPEMHGTPSNAVDTAIALHSLALRQELLREWRDWNNSVGAADDIRDLLNWGFGATVHFRTPLEARNFMNSVYDKLIVSVRDETSRNWKL